MDFNAYAMMDILKIFYCNAKSAIKGVKLAYKIQPSVLRVMVTRLLITINVFVKTDITLIRILLVNCAQINVYYANILHHIV